MILLLIINLFIILPIIFLIFTYFKLYAAKPKNIKLTAFAPYTISLYTPYSLTLNYLLTFAI